MTPPPTFGILLSPPQGTPRTTNPPAIMFLVIETYSGCTPEIPTRLFPSWEDAMEHLHDCAETADRAAHARGEDPWGNGNSGLAVTKYGTARVWGNGEDPVWSAIIARIPGS